MITVLECDLQGAVPLDESNSFMVIIIVRNE